MADSGTFDRQGDTGIVRKPFVSLIIVFTFTYPHASSAASERPASIIGYSRAAAPGIESKARVLLRPNPSPRAGNPNKPPSAALEEKNPTFLALDPVTPNLAGQPTANLCSSASGVVRFSVVDGVDCHARAAPVRNRPDKPGRRRRRPPRVSAEQLASIAYDRARALAPDARLEVTPDAVGLTGLSSYFHLDSPPQPISATASAGGLTVTAAARPIQFIWDFGDGKNDVTTHSGRAWSRTTPGNVDHLYERVGRYDLAVEVIWQAQWRVNGGPWQPLGYFETSDSRSYPVRQVRSALVRRR